MCNGECLIGFGRSRRQASVGLYACSFLLWLQLFQQCFSSRRKLRLFPFNSKKATAAIPTAVEQCTTLYIAQRQVFLTKNLLLPNTTDILVRSELTSVSKFAHEFFASKKHRYCMESPPSMAVLKMYILYIFDCEFCLTSKHRVCLIPAASVPLLSVHPCTLLNDTFLLSTATEGRRIEQKRCLPLQTRKSIYNTDVVN